MLCSQNKFYLFLAMLLSEASSANISCFLVRSNSVFLFGLLRDSLEIAVPESRIYGFCKWLHWPLPVCRFLLVALNTVENLFQFFDKNATKQLLSTSVFLIRKRSGNCGWLFLWPFKEIAKNTNLWNLLQFLLTLGLL